MRVIVDDTRCQGHGRCFLDCPEVFDSDEEGFAFVTTDEPDPSLSHKVDDAVAGCPEQAIRIEG